MSESFDRRITPARADLAAAHLQGRVTATSFVHGQMRSVLAPQAPLRREPRADCPLDTEALRGEIVTVYDEAEGWSWVQLARDGYVGYMPSETLGAEELPTHRVSVMRALVFPGPNLKLPVVSALPFGARVAVWDTSGPYSRIAEGWVWSEHLASAEARESDFVTVAERFKGVPYLWGGKTGLGLDCSGLVQTSLDATGIACPRDSDMQQRDLGRTLSTETALLRGDLVFWPGHVGVMRDGQTLLHANGHAMLVASEPLAAARDRIKANTGSDVAVVKRLTP